MIFWVYDACIPCAILGMVYKQGKKVRRIWGENIVQHLCSKLRNTRDNITTDNRFSSVPLPQCLLQTLLWGLYNRTRQTSFLGWRFPSPGRFTAQSLHSNLCMVSYITKKGMAVWLWLLSMMHHNTMVDENTRKRKNIIYHILQQAQKRCRYQCLHLFHGSALWIQERHHHSMAGLPHWALKGACHTTYEKSTGKLPPTANPDHWSNGKVWVTKATTEPQKKSRPTYGRV